MNASHWRQKQIFYCYIFSAPLIYCTSHSLTAPASTSWVTCVLFVATTKRVIGSTCVLFVATTVYSVSGHCYELEEHMYCLWPLLKSHLHTNSTIIVSNSIIINSVNYDLYTFCYIIPLPTILGVPQRLGSVVCLGSVPG